MGKKKETGMSIHEKALRLIEGGVVACNGHAVRAIEVVGDDIACNYCDMDSACNMEMTDLCAECDMISHTRHLLKFAHT